MRRIRASLLCAALTAVLTAGGVRAQDAEREYFKGKTVQMTVGFAAGGGYDAYARLIGPAIAKELGATVVVMNVVGAGGIISVNDIAKSPPDGLKMSLVNGWSNGLSQILEVEGVRYDLDKMGMLGTISASPSVWIVGKRPEIGSIAAIRASGAPLNFAITSYNDGLYVGAAIACVAMRIPCRYVLGYRGTNDGFISVARGETDAIYLGDTSAHNYVTSGDVRAIATMARKRSQLFPDLPTIFELEKLSDEAEWLIDFHSVVESLGRILVVPPGMSPERLGFMRKAVERALNDPVIVETGRKSQRYIQFISGEETQAAVRRTIGSLKDEDRRKLKTILAQPAK